MSAVNMVLISFYCKLKNNILFRSGFCRKFNSVLPSVVLGCICAACNARRLPQCFSLLCFSVWDAVWLRFGFGAVNANLSVMYLAFLLITKHLYACLPAIVLCHCLCSCGFMLITTVGLLISGFLKRINSIFIQKLPNLHVRKKKTEIKWYLKNIKYQFSVVQCEYFAFSSVHLMWKQL